MPNSPTYAQDRFTLKEKLQYSLIGIVVVGGCFFIGRSMVRKVISSNEQKHTFEDGDPAAFAQQIRMAFENDGWPGKDLAALRSVMQAIPSLAVFKSAIVSYQRLYNRSLMEDMKSSLKTTEYNEMLAILNAKPDRGTYNQPLQLTALQYVSWAKRLKAAFDKTYGIFPGTDEAAIKAVFMEIPSQLAFNQLALTYQKLYGNDLDHDLRSELEFWEYPSYMKIIADKPNH